MRRKIMIAVLITCAIAAICCFSIIIAEYGYLSQLVNGNNPLYNMYPIKAYQVGENYAFVIFENGKAVKAVVFSEDRQPIHTIGVAPVAIADIDQYLVKTLEDIETEFGSYHVDIGSGYCMPSYVTTDGYLVSFTLGKQHGDIIHVGKTDLFTGDAIEWFTAGAVK